MTSRAPEKTGSITLPTGRFLGLSPRAYACIVDGQGMIPLFHSGDVIVIDPDRIPAIGDTVLLWPANIKDGPTVRRCADMQRRMLHVETISPASRQRVHRDALAMVHVVVGALSPDEVETARRAGVNLGRTILPPPHAARCAANPMPRASR